MEVSHVASYLDVSDGDSDYESNFEANQQKIIRINKRISKSDKLVYKDGQWLVRNRDIIEEYVNLLAESKVNLADIQRIYRETRAYLR